MIDAGEGLGEAVVSGLVTPDRFVVAQHPTRITERRLGRRDTVIRARPGGGTEEITTGGVATAPALPARVVRTLARLGPAGVLDGPEDVFHLTAEELARAGEPWPPLPSAGQALRRAAYRARRGGRRWASGSPPTVGSPRGRPEPMRC